MDTQINNLLDTVHHNQLVKLQEVQATLQQQEPTMLEVAQLTHQQHLTTITSHHPTHLHHQLMEARSRQDTSQSLLLQGTQLIQVLMQVSLLHLNQLTIHLPCTFQLHLHTLLQKHKDMCLPMLEDTVPFKRTLMRRKRRSQ